MALNSPNPAAIVVKGLMDEANQDGKQYARQDGEWSEVAPAAGKNILINGNLTIDQRGKSQFGHALPTDDFVWDRWMLVANGSPQIYQIVEEGNYEPNTVYTLSWDGAEPQQATSPASGHWNIKNSFSVLPQWSSKKIQLEKGDTATEFEFEDIGTTLTKCQRYCELIDLPYQGVYFPSMLSGGLGIQAHGNIHFLVEKRDIPTSPPLDSIEYRSGSTLYPNTTGPVTSINCESKILFRLSSGVLPEVGIPTQFYTYLYDTSPVGPPCIFDAELPA